MAPRLKALGLTAVALLAATALMAAAAQADHPAVITAEEYPAFGDGEQLENVILTKAGRVTTCEAYEGGASIEGPSSTATVTGSLSNCSTSIGPVTVTMNGCSLVFHVTEETEPTTYTATGDLECPVGQVMESHIYTSETKHTEGTSVCTQTIPPQNGLTGIDLTNVAGKEGEPDYVIAHLNVGGITSISHGSILICGATHGTATLTGSLKLWATNKEGVKIDADVGPEA